jgi:signal transduction histidine kinase/DNA-binding response OmpR family regulator
LPLSPASSAFLARLDDLLDGRSSSSDALAAALEEVEDDVRPLAARVLALLRERPFTRDQLLQMAKLAQVGLDFAELIHELRQPLTGVVGFAELLKTHPDAREATVWQQEILRHGQRLETLVEGLRRHVRPHAFGDTVVEVNRIAREAASVIPFPPGVHVNLELASELPSVSANPGRLLQILTNLLGNARDAASEKGEGTVWVRTSRTPAGVEIAIADDGPGLAPSVRAKLFDPFVTTKGDSGTGLGLYICREIARELGAELTLVEPAPQGTSTAFALRLCARQEAAPATQRADETIDDALLGDATFEEAPGARTHLGREARSLVAAAACVPARSPVLLADDSATRRVVRVVLALEEGIDLFEATTHEEARGLLDRCPSSLALCASPWGLDLLRRSRPRPSPAEWMLLTDNATVDLLLAGIDAGASDWIFKPIADLAALRVKVGAAARRARLRKIEAHLAARTPGWAERLRGAVSEPRDARVSALSKALCEYGESLATTPGRFVVAGTPGASDTVFRAGHVALRLAVAKALPEAVADDHLDGLVIGAELSGEDALRLARGALEGPRCLEVVWLTHDPDRELAVAMVSAGVREVMTGPLSAERLGQRLERALSRCRERARLSALDLVIRECRALS